MISATGKSVGDFSDPPIIQMMSVAGSKISIIYGCGTVYTDSQDKMLFSGFEYGMVPRISLQLYGGVKKILSSTNLLDSGLFILWINRAHC